MNDDSTVNRKPAPDRHRLWSRLTSALGRLRSLPAAEDPPPCNAPDAAPLTSLPDRFSRQLFANLLLELPQHRQAFTSAWLASDWQSLADCTHRLAGAVAYCDLPDLSEALAELGTALREDDELARQQTYNRATREIDDLLNKSGLRQP